MEVRFLMVGDVEIVPVYPLMLMRITQINAAHQTMDEKAIYKAASVAIYLYLGFDIQ